MARITAELTLHVAVHKVDEMGFFLVTKPPDPEKAPVFWMSAPIVTEITGVTTAASRSPVASERGALPSQGGFNTYVEFENPPMIS